MTPPPRPTLDREAFTSLVQPHQDGLRAYMAARAPRLTEADDLAQQTVLIAFEKRATFRADADFGAWLFGIARNVVRQAWDGASRERAGRDALALRMARELADRISDRPEDDEERLDALRACLEELPPRGSKLIALRYRKARPLAAIAESLGRTAQSLAVTLHRLRRQLRECVERRLRRNA